MSPGGVTPIGWRPTTAEDLELEEAAKEALDQYGHLIKGLDEAAAQATGNDILG